MSPVLTKPGWLCCHMDLRPRNLCSHHKAWATTELSVSVKSNQWTKGDPRRDLKAEKKVLYHPLTVKTSTAYGIESAQEMKKKSYSNLWKINSFDFLGPYIVGRYNWRRKHTPHTLHRSFLFNWTQMSNHAREDTFQCRQAVSDPMQGARETLLLARGPLHL